MKNKGFLVLLYLSNDTKHKAPSYYFVSAESLSRLIFSSFSWIGMKCSFTLGFPITSRMHYPL